MTTFTDAAAAAVARTISEVKREAARERELREAQFAAKMAELDGRLASVADAERRLSDRLATLKDGRDGTDGKDGASVAIDDVMPDLIARVEATASARAEVILEGWERPRDGVDGKDGTSVTIKDIEPLLRTLIDAIPAPKDGQDGENGRDGKDADPELIRSMVVEAVAEIPVPKDGVDGKDGASVTLEDVAPMIETRIAEAVAEIPVPKDGRDGVDGANGRDGIDGKDGQPGERGEQGEPGPRGEKGEPGIDGIDGKDGEIGPKGATGERGIGIDDCEVRAGDDGEAVFSFTVGGVEREFSVALPMGPKGEKGEAGETGPQGPVGALPAVEAWQDKVYYAGAVVTKDGGVYQALSDTGKEPGHADWLCIVSRGENGADGRSFHICGTFADGNTYHSLDVVQLNGASFVAKRDDPGECPGPGWQMIAMQGRRGRAGETGPQGERGEPGASGIEAMALSKDGLFTITGSDGVDVACDFYPVLSSLER